MTQVPIYDSEGQEVDRLDLNDTIIFTNGRVSQGQKHYYKGVGIPYAGHMINDDYFDSEKYDLVEKSDVFYLGFHVEKDVFKGKTGIFQEKYQPQFTDFIGSCGVKELAIIENSEVFEKSSVRIIKVVNYDKINYQYYLELDYSCGRKKYLSGGHPEKLRELIDYMVASGWNFVWDKNTIDDISYDGQVSDVGDLFYSKELSHKIGTVYSVLYSLYNSNVEEYEKLLAVYGLKHEDFTDIVFNTLQILKMNGVDVFSLYRKQAFETYKNVVMNYIIMGRNCGHCCYIDLGEQIKNQYILQTEKQLTNSSE